MTVAEIGALILQLIVGLLSCTGVLFTLFVTMVGWLYTSNEQRKVLVSQQEFERRRAEYSAGMPHVVSKLNIFTEWLDNGFQCYLETISLKMGSKKYKAEQKTAYDKRMTELEDQFNKWLLKFWYFSLLSEIWDKRFGGQLEKLFDQFQEGIEDVMRWPEDRCQKMLDVHEDKKKMAEVGVIYARMNQLIDDYVWKAISEIQR